MSPSQWVADFHHGRRGQSMTAERPTTCCHCPKALPKGRFIFCSSECALEAQRVVWRKAHPSEARPARLGSLSAYLAWLRAR